MRRERIEAERWAVARAWGPSELGKGVGFYFTCDGKSSDDDQCFLINEVSKSQRQGLQGLQHPGN